MGRWEWTSAFWRHVAFDFDGRIHLQRVSMFAARPLPITGGYEFK